MDGALSVKNIDYGKVNLHITKSGGDVNQPTITTEHFPLYGKEDLLSLSNLPSKLYRRSPFLQTTEARGGL